MTLSQQRRGGLIAVGVVLAACLLILGLIGLKVLTHTWAEHSFNQEFPTSTPAQVR